MRAYILKHFGESLITVFIVILADEENKDYIKFAVSKGLPMRSVMIGHMLRNALVPLVQYLPTQILLTIAGSLIIESIYSIPGLGGLLVYAIR